MSPIYPKLKEAGAIFGQVMGYERPNWFDCDNILGTVLNVLVIRTSRFWKQPVVDLRGLLAIGL